MMKKLLVTVTVVALLLLAFLGTAAAAITTANTTTKVVHLSDFHYDPLFATSLAESGKCRKATTPKWGLLGCDSSYEMVDAALNDAFNTTIHPDVAFHIYTGDWMRHGMAGLHNSSAVASQIIDTIAGLIRKYDQKKQQIQQQQQQGVILPAHHRYRHVLHPFVPIALGNEDFIPDYFFNYSNPTQTLLQNITDILVHHEMLSGEEATTFQKCAYFSRNMVSASNLTILAMNTLLYSNKLKPKTSAADPCGQFAWLRSELTRLRSAGHKAYLLSHIPPGVEFWGGHFITTYKAILTEFNDVISAQFFGHTHLQSFGAMSSTNSVAPFFVGGPITRVSSSNPCYEIYDIDASTYAVTDITVHYLKPNSWSWGALPSYRQQFAAHLPDLTTASLYKFGQAMRHSMSLFVTWFTYFSGGALYPGQKCFKFHSSAINSALCEHTWSCFTYASFSVGEAMFCML